MGDGVVSPDEPTQLAASEHETASVWAWGLAEDYDDVPTSRFTPARITAAAVAVSVLLVAVAGGVAWSRMHGTPVAEPTPTMVKAGPTPPSVVPVALPTVTILSQPPVTVTVAAPVPTAVPVPDPGDIVDPDTGVSPNQLARWDARFLSILADDGWDAKNPKGAAIYAHRFCADMTNGVPLAASNQNIAVESGLGMKFAMAFTSAAMTVYPGCRAPLGG